MKAFHSTFRPHYALALVILASVSCSRQPEQASKQAGPAKPETNVTSACAGDVSWVQNPSQPNFSLDPTTDCQFHQYAWQSFLFLTSPSPAGGLNFENYRSVEDIFSTPASRTAIKMADPRNKRNRIFRPRFGKPTHEAAIKAQAKALASGEPFNEDQQAGSGGVLISQSNQITYYEQLMDPTAARFVTSCSLQVANCQTQPAAKPLRIPAGAIEIKASWLPMSKSTPNANMFYTIPGFPVMNNQGQTYTPDLMALVGMHLVFATKSHPELVWATFEHIANAPNGPCVAGQSTPPPAPFTTWTFNNPANTSCQGINAWPQTNPPTKPPFPVAQAVRIEATGGGSAGNTAAIQSLNASVLGLVPTGSLWKNYFMVGSVWTVNGQLPPSSTNQAGSTLLANSTMETFVQDGSTDCFSCHTNTSRGGTIEPPFIVSHAFKQATSKKTCSYTTQLPQACQATQ